MVVEYNNYLEDQASGQNHPFKTSNVIADDIFSSFKEILTTITDDQASLTKLSAANSTLTTSQSSTQETIKTIQKKLNSMTQKFALMEYRLFKLETGTPTPGGGQKKDKA